MVRRTEEETKTAGGIVLPDSATEKPSQGVVVAVGSGKKTKDGIVAMELKVNDKVLFSKYSGTEVKVDGEELLIMKEDDVIATIN